MKKLYALTAMFAAMSFSAFAQTSFMNEDVKDAALLNEKTYLESSVIRKAEGDPKAPIGYAKPAGVYYIGYSEKYYGYNATSHLMVPPFAELTFKGEWGDTVNGMWTYVDPEGEYSMFNPKKTSTEKTLNVSYAYPKPTQIEVPSLTGTGDHNTDSLFMGSSWMQIAKPYLGSTTAGRYGMGNNPTGKVFWKNIKYYNSSIFTYNSNYQDIPFQQRWLNQYKSWYGADNVTAVNVKALGEYFDKPASPITLIGFLVHGRCTTEIGGDFKLTIRNANSEILAYLIKKKEDILPTSSGGTTYMLKFDDMYDANGNSIDELILDEEFYAFLELQDETTQFSLYYFQAPGNVTMYTLLDWTYQGTERTNTTLLAGGKFADGSKNRSFCIYMLGQFEWLKGDITEYEAPKNGGNAQVNFNASKEYLTPMERDPNWIVTLEDGSALPSWITVNVVDNFDTELYYEGSSVMTITVAPQGNESEAREAVVMVTYKGATHFVKITQEGTSTGINDLTVENNDNAPAYNLAGQRVNNNATGVVIKNGKKIIKK